MELCIVTADMAWAEVEAWEASAIKKNAGLDLDDSNLTYYVNSFFYF